MDQPDAIAALAALAHDTRLAAFRRLVAAAPEGLAAGALAAGASLSGSTMAHHLAQLEAAGLVTVRRAGRSAVYAARIDAVATLAAFLTEDCCGGHPDRCASAAPASVTSPGSDAAPTVTIYHNPACGTSRNVLAMIRATGTEPRIVEYLTDPPDRATLERLIAAVDDDRNPRALIRAKGTPYAALGLDDDGLTDVRLIDAMLAHPMLIERPVVVTPKGTALCRPSERVLDLLDAPLPPGFVKEDGTPVAA